MRTGDLSRKAGTLRTKVKAGQRYQLVRSDVVTAIERIGCVYLRVKGQKNSSGNNAMKFPANQPSGTTSVNSNQSLQVRTIHSHSFYPHAPLCCSSYTTTHKLQAVLLTFSSNSVQLRLEGKWYLEQPSSTPQPVQRIPTSIAKMSAKSLDPLSGVASENSRALFRVVILCLIAAAAIASRLFSVIRKLTLTIALTLTLGPSLVRPH